VIRRGRSNGDQSKPFATQNEIESFAGDPAFSQYRPLSREPFEDFDSDVAFS
jgi:hypothetical protein